MANKHLGGQQTVRQNWQDVEFKEVFSGRVGRISAPLSELRIFAKRECPVSRAFRDTGITGIRGAEGVGKSSGTRPGVNECNRDVSTVICRS